MNVDNMGDQQNWHGEYEIETSATPDVIWRFFRDVPAWKSWNAGIESAHLNGPFATGTEYTMKPPGQDALHSRLVEVRERECFVDETRMGDMVVRVAHRIQPAGHGRTRVTYVLDAVGPGAAEAGPAIASDFMDVLQALASLAEACEPAATPPMHPHIAAPRAPEP